MFTLCHLVLRGTFQNQKTARPYLEQNNVSMMSQTSDALWSWHIPLLPSSRTRIPPGFNCWTSVAPVFQYWSCSWVLSMLNLDLYVAVLVHWWWKSFARTEQLIYLWSTSEPRARVTAAWNRFKPPDIYYWRFQGGASVVVYSNCICSLLDERLYENICIWKL